MRVCVWKLVRACILYTYVAAALVHLGGVREFRNGRVHRLGSRIGCD